MRPLGERIANDRHVYTWRQFYEYYGASAEAKWQSATPISAAQPAPMHIAVAAASTPASLLYEFYSRSAEARCQSATPVSAAQPSPSNLPALAANNATTSGTPVSAAQGAILQISGAPANAALLNVTQASAAQPAPSHIAAPVLNTASTRSTPASAAQPAATQISGPPAGAAQFPGPAASATQTASSISGSAAQAAALPVLLTWADLKQMPFENNKGGKAARIEQRRLRSFCFEQNIWEFGASCDTYDWRQLLKSLPEVQAQIMIGPGVVSFTFRLLQNVMDHNYFKFDTGQTHVFESVCSNGDRKQLHFHKNGSMDTPTLLTNTAAPCPVLHTQSSAGQPIELSPAWTFDMVKQNARDVGPPLGRIEVNVALDTLFVHYAAAAKTWPRAVDITDPISFPWPRWLLNVTKNLDIVKSGIVKVYIKRDQPAPFRITLVFCRATTHMQKSRRTKNDDNRKKPLARSTRFRSGSLCLTVLDGRAEKSIPRVLAGRSLAGVLYSLQQRLVLVCTGYRHAWCLPCHKAFSNWCCTAQYGALCLSCSPRVADRCLDSRVGPLILLCIDSGELRTTSATACLPRV